MNDMKTLSNVLQDFLKCGILIVNKLYIRS